MKILIAGFSGQYEQIEKYGIIKLWLLEKSTVLQMEETITTNGFELVDFKKNLMGILKDVSAILAKSTRANVP